MALLDQGIHLRLRAFPILNILVPHQAGSRSRCLPILHRNGFGILHFPPAWTGDSYVHWVARTRWGLPGLDAAARRNSSGRIPLDNFTLTPFDKNGEISDAAINDTA